MLTLGEKAERALKIVREAASIAYDTETSGLDWKVNSPIGYVITESAAENYYIPVRHGGGGNLADPNCAPMREKDEKTVTHQFEIELEKAFEERRARGYLTIGHNLGFDMHFSANHGIYLGRECEDTQINAAMLDEFARSFSLDGCAKAAGVTAKKGEDLYAFLAKTFGGVADRKQMDNFWRTNGSDPEIVDYATGDGITTLELREYQRKLILEEDMDFINRVENQLIWTVFRIERRGIKVDADRIQYVEEEVARRLHLAMGRLPPRFNVRSAPQVKKYMKECERTDWPLTDAGNPSFTEKWLKKFPEGKLIVDVRKLTNLMNSFVTPLKERHVHNGRVHSQLNQLKSDEYGTISGRFSSSNPNMQQVPKRDKELGRLFRSIFVADEGMEYNEGDYSQCEPRLFAHYSQEPALLDGYNQVPFKDVHAVVAENFGCDRDVTAKRMNMGIFTGMQAKSFAGHMEWDLERATNAWNQWFEMFPAIRGFQDKAKGIFKSSGYVRTLLKRRCRLENPRFAYRATSRIIQGGNADILKERMLCVDKELERNETTAHLLMNCHDAYSWQSMKGSAGEKLSAEMVRMFEDVQGPPYNLLVPFTMDIGKGPNWAVATWGEELASTK